ncbi:pirin family protein [Aeromicrobium sp.]|uniref:pirin family protein n=1 Tax=Aeromicrobium sp. TaxID=1871063 RepID=UPI0019BDB0E1|nr:pirin family protein [Aeromicrobium sp.]MBC7630173.1 pirin family protein [Aeromicrobium sp.]
MTTFAQGVSVLHRLDQFQPPALGGVMQANKPVVGGRTSTGELSAGLFYWSHSRFVGDFEFGLHRHEGFEIATFILEGENSHYDTATRKWATLHAGDVQIIRSGSGISHNERVAKGSRAFQIWFDPDYHAALALEPSYTDYPAARFTSRTVAGATVTDLISGDGPVEAHTEGLVVRRIAIDAGASARVDVGADRFTLGYVINGAATVNDSMVGADDAFTLNGNTTLEINAAGATDVFVVSVPNHPSYQPVRQR